MRKTATTNVAMHEQFVSFQRRFCSGESLLSWLPGMRIAYLKRFVRVSKKEPILNLVYGRVHYPRGPEVTARLRNFTPCPQVQIVESVSPNTHSRPLCHSEQVAADDFTPGSIDSR